MTAYPINMLSVVECLIFYVWIVWIPDILRGSYKTVFTRTNQLNITPKVR